MNNYEDIINLKHHVSIKHPQMSIMSRAAQFAPFAALTGYDESVKESARRTSKKIELDNDYKTILNKKLEYIILMNYKNKVSFVYFQKDLKKEGGKYIEKEGVIKKIDNIEGYIILEDKTKIKIDDIIEINSEILNKLDSDYFETYLNDIE